MVRFKNRYLLFDITYTDTPLGLTSIPWSSVANSANITLGNRPYPDPSSSSTAKLKHRQQEQPPPPQVQSIPGATPTKPYGDTGRNNYRLPTIATKDLVNAIKDSVSENFGDYGSGITQSSIVVKYFSPHTNMGIIRIARDHFHIIWAAMTFLKDIKGRGCLFKIIHTSGTIKNCQLEAMRYDRDRILYLRNQAQQNKDEATAKLLQGAFTESAQTIAAIEI